jgi:single-strand DNA-binding protein
MVNKVILIGNLGADPEKRYTASGSAVVTLRLATSRKWKDRDGNPQEETEWHRVIVWGPTAEFCANYLNKGSKIYVEGRLKTNKWQDQSGNDRFTTEVIAQTVQNLTPRSGDSAGGGNFDEPPLPPEPFGGTGSASTGDDVPF